MPDPGRATNPVSEPTGTLEQALAHANRLLSTDPALAGEQATEILKVVRNHAQATLLLGLAQGRLGRGEDAVRTLRRAVDIEPALPRAWLALGDHLAAAGDARAAETAYANHLRYSSRDPRLLAAGTALVENRIPEAEALLRAHLRQLPTDVAAIRMLAEVAARLGRHEDAENLLARCIELAPGFREARQNYALVLHRGNQPERALAEIETLLATDPANPGYRNLKAVILSGVGEYAQAIALFGQLAAEYPNHGKLWLSYGHTLKTAGKQADSIAAYRRSLALDPSFGEAWWSLANLKTVRFDDADIATMRAQLARTDLDDANRYHLDFALGKALEDRAEYAASFGHYAAGNALRRKSAPYSADVTTSRLQRAREIFTRGFFAERAGWGVPDRDPIFVVGLPRSGSTLIEQILASHSQVEGTMELPELISISRALKREGGNDPAQTYYDQLATLDAAAVRALGERYLERTRIQRKTGLPFFVDKMPNNFLHAGLIHLALPNARIVDARRHPLGCCLSAFKQHFARGQNFTYDLADVGRYYRDYVGLMAHFDRVLPGRVHRVIYEEMVDDTEREVRRLLDYCGLPFEDGCLRFFENERPVRTASSEQVRQPIYKSGVDQWRHYDVFLDPLRDALGPVLDAYPAAPGEN